MKELPSEAWRRAGFEIVNNRLVRIKDAKRTVSQTSASGAAPEGSTGTSEQGPEDPGDDPELSHTIDEEPEDGDNGGGSERSEEETSQASADYQAGTAGVDEAGYSPFRISVNFCVSNRGRRDPTGAYETICDLITATRRRLAQRLAERNLVGDIREPRRGGSHHHVGKNLKEKEVPF